MDKFFNRAIIGNKNIVTSFTEHGELQRFCYPFIDGRQFVDFFHVGVKVNDSNIVYLHDDINNAYGQEFVKNTNVLVTDIENSYFNLKIQQLDCCLIDRNVLLKKYVLKNENEIDLSIKFIVNSKILAGSLENFGSKIYENGIVQYNHNYAFCIFSRAHLFGHRLNDVPYHIESANIQDKDYIGMSNEIAISYDLGTIKPGEQTELTLYVWACDNSSDLDSQIAYELKFNDQKELDETKNYWKNYVSEHASVKVKNEDSDFNKRLMQIYNRTILLYPLLINYEYGGVAAALEVDDNRARSGGYRYCWPRDAIFITKALDLLKMNNETELFYNKFCRLTQSKNGMWEQRFFTDGRLAPCWGYQVDETASVVFGIYEHYENTRDKNFLEENLKMCKNAVKFLIDYTENVLNVDDDDCVKKELQAKYKKSFEPAKQLSYDLWEMNEGVHLYSLCAIIACFRAMIKIYELLDDNDTKNSRLKIEKRNKIIVKLNRYIVFLQDFIRQHFIDKDSKTLKRNLNDSKMDVSVMGAIYPFDIFDVNEKVVRNTVDKINMTLRTYRDGYLRFEGDAYIGGDKPWIITTLWMALYYIKLGDVESAEKCFKYVVNTCSKYGFLSEQVSNDDQNFQWVIGLGWSHAMFVIVLDELLKYYDRDSKENG